MTTIGQIELIARIDTSQYEKGADDIKKKNKEIEGSAEKSSSKTSAVWGKVAKVGLAAVAVGFATITTRVDDAIRRIDTLVAFPRVLQAMGASANDAQKATTKLSDKLQGLPTALQDGAKGVQEFVAAGLSAGKATDAFLAVNNALLASGGNAMDTGIVMDSLTRAMSGGKTAASTMQAALSRMPTVLQALQEQTGKSSGELFKLYANDPQKLTDALIELNQKGGGGLASLEEQAKAATGGIGTAFSNMGNAIDRGLQSIVTAIGSGDLEAGQLRVSGAITNVGKAFGAALIAIGSFIPKLVELGTQVGDYLAPKLTALWNTISTQLLPALNNLWKNVIQPLIPVVGTALVLAIGLAIDAINLIVLALTPLINFLGDNKEAVWAVIGAITAWYAIMKVTAAFNVMYNSIAIARARLFGLTTQIGTTRAAFGLLNKALSTPITMAIFVGAALIAIQKVYEAAQKTLKVFDELNSSREGLSRSTTDAMERSQKLLRQARASGDKKSEERILRSMRAIAGASSGFAQGGFTGQGRADEVAGLVHRGEFVIPKNLVDQNTGTPKMGTTIEIGNIHIAKEVDADRFFERLTKEQEIISKGMTPGAFNV
jgi:tape measure domain-containing protein